MKKLIFLLIIGFSGGHLNASHMAGGEIWYEFTGDANNPYSYRIWLQFYRDVSGIAAPMNEEISIKSSCFPDRCVNLVYAPFVLQPGSDTTYGSVSGSILTPDLQECVDISSGGTFVQTEIYRFYADVTLDGTCHDWTFGFNENARNANDNLGTGGTGTFYIEAKLNNTVGPNSSPVFVNPAAKSFCVGSPFVWSQAAIEPDGIDSLHFDFGVPLYSSDACPVVPSQVGFAAGYSRSQPMSTVSGINIDHKNGTFTFTPSAQEVDVINVTVTEYRFDSLRYQWLANGSSVRDLQVPVLAGCKKEAAGGPKLDYSAPGFKVTSVDRDSIFKYLSGLGINNVKIDSTPAGGGNFDYSMGVIEYDCYDSIVHLDFNIDVLCSSISGDEFSIVSVTDSATRPVIKVPYTCKTDLTTNSVDLLLHKPLDVNGTYFLMVKKGDDGNTLTNRCGFELQEFYTMMIEVTNCPTLDYKVENVSVIQDQVVEVTWWMNPSYSRPQTEKLFNSWNILRANGDQQFYILDRLEQKSDINKRTYIDTSLEQYNLDMTQYQYQVQLVQNFDFKAPTDYVNTILLTDTLMTDSVGWELSWTEYNAWPQPMYEFFIGEKDTSTNQIDWNSEAGPDSTLFTAEFLIPDPMTSEDEGIYVVKVEATDALNPSNTYVSQSNWLFYELTSIDPENPEPPEDVVAPNVFTPDGDGVNDIFYVNGKGYTEASIQVYNRWGKLVYETSESKAREVSQALPWDGSDMNSGEILSNGTYFYVLDLSDQVTGESESMSGTVNIFGE